MSEKDDFIYDEDESVAFIQNYLPQELKGKFSNDDINYIVDLIYEYYESKGFLSDEVDENSSIDIDEDELVQFVINKIILFTHNLFILMVHSIRKDKRIFKITSKSPFFYFISYLNNYHKCHNYGHPYQNNPR